MIFRKRSRKSKGGLDLKKTKDRALDPKAQIEALAGKPEAQLIAVANSDAPDAVRTAAIAQLRYSPELLALAQNHERGRVQQSARKRLGELLQEEQISLSQLQSDVPDRQLWMTLASHSVRAGQHLLQDLTEPADYLHLAIYGATIDVRQAAAEKLHTRDELEQLCQAAQGRDKTVYRLAKSRLDEFKIEDARQAEREAEGHAICNKLRQLSRVPEDPLYAAKLDKLEQDWRAIAEALPVELHTLYQEVLSACQAPLLAQAQARAEEQAQQAQREQMQNKLHIAVEQAENVLRSLYGTDEAALNDDSFSAQIQQLQQTLASLESLPEAELAPLKQHIHNAERLLAHLREHGSLPSLTQALEESSDDESAHEQSILKEALRASRQLRHPLPETVSAAQALLDQRQASAKAERRVRDKQLRELEQLIRRGLAAANGGRVRQARGIHRASLEQRAAAGDLPNHISAQLEKLDAAIERLSDWHEFAVTPKKHELIEQMQGLVDSPMAPEDLARKIHDLQDDWKQLSKGVPHADEQLWQEFQAASEKAFAPCREFFDAQAKEREANQAHRDRLIEQLQTYVDGYDWDNPDWKQVENTFRQARQEWRQYWPVPRQAAKAQQARFEPLMDQLHDKLSEAYERHKAAKEQLIAQAQQLTEETNLETAITSAKTLQARWKTIGKTRPRDDSRLWKSFRRHCDAIFARRQEQYAAADQARQEQLDQAKEIIARLEALLAQDVAELSREKQNVRALKDEFDQLRDLPRAQAPKVKAELQKIVKAIDQKLAQERSEAQARQWQNLQQINATLHRAESQVLQGQDATETLDAARAAMEQMKQWPGNSQALLQARLDSANQVTPDVQKASEQQLSELNIRADILAGVESPENERSLRMSYQMQRLQQGLGQAEQDTPKALLMDWLALRALDSARYEAALVRLEPALLSGRP